MDIILKYFPDLTALQKEQFGKLDALYRDWNSKINLISRKDIDHLYEHHILHSLAVAKFITFKPGTAVLDLGTGGGFPGIPLAILFPEVQFTLVDGTGKKIMVVQDIAEQTGLKNVNARHVRVEELKNVQFDFVVTRAVADLEELVRWTQRLYKKSQRNIFPNGLIALKGGKLEAEIKALPKGNYIEFEPLSSYFSEEYFQEKFVVYVQG